MKLSILIVNYNGKKYLGDCLASIRKKVSVEYEVIIVDNASTDGSCDYLREFFPEITLIISDRNLGFAGGNNRAANAATGEYLMLLNNDTVLLTDIKPALEVLENNQTIGIAAALMLNGNKEYCPSAGNFPVPLRLIRIASVFKSTGYFRQGNFPHQHPERGYRVDWAAGSFLLLKRSLWQSLAGLDEGYFMYGEDADFCRRALDAGFTTAYCPTVQYIHYGGFDPSRFHLIIKGYQRYHQKFSPVFSRTLASGILFSGLIARAFMYGLLFIMTHKTSYGVKTKTCLASLKL